MVDDNPNDRYTETLTETIINDNNIGVNFIIEGRLLDALVVFRQAMTNASLLGMPTTATEEIELGGFVSLVPVTQQEQLREEQHQPSQVPIAEAAQSPPSQLSEHVFQHGMLLTPGRILTQHSIGAICFNIALAGHLRVIQNAAEVSQTGTTLLIRYISLYTRAEFLLRGTSLNIAPLNNVLHINYELCRWDSVDVCVAFLREAFAQQDVFARYSPVFFRGETLQRILLNLHLLKRPEVARSA